MVWRKNLNACCNLFGVWCKIFFIRYKILNVWHRVFVICVKYFNFAVLFLVFGFGVKSFKFCVTLFFLILYNVFFIWLIFFHICCETFQFWEIILIDWCNVLLGLVNSFKCFVYFSLNVWCILFLIIIYNLLNKSFSSFL